MRHGHAHPTTEAATSSSSSASSSCSQRILLYAAAAATTTTTPQRSTRIGRRHRRTMRCYLLGLVLSFAVTTTHRMFRSVLGEEQEVQVDGLLLNRDGDPFYNRKSDKNNDNGKGMDMAMTMMMKMKEQKRQTTTKKKRNNNNQGQQKQEERRPKDKGGGGGGGGVEKKKKKKKKVRKEAGQTGNSNMVDQTDRGPNRNEGSGPTLNDGAGGGSGDRPNLLLIVTDQQRYDTLGIVQRRMRAYEDKFRVETPGIDRLARRGVLFESAYCGSSSCAPARAVLRTGCALQRTGVTRNRMVNDDFINRMPIMKRRIDALTTFEQILVDQCGYQAVTIGKWHAPKRFYYSKQNPQQRIISYNYYDYKEKEWKFQPFQLLKYIYRRTVHYLVKRQKVDVRFRPGQQLNTMSEYPYTPIRLDPRYGKRTNTRLSRANGFDPYELTFATIYGVDALPPTLTLTGVTGRMAVKALDRLITEQQQQSSASNEKKPFSLAVHFLAPHPPILPTASSASYYKKRQNRIYVSKSIHDPMKNSPYADANGRQKAGAFSNEATVAELSAHYYGMITEVDEWVGQLMDRLERANILDNTLIIFTADHGEMLGAHGMRNKFNMYEESVRVPLIMSFKDMPANKTIREPVGHIDVFATILDYLGVSMYDQSDGRTLRRFIEQSVYNFDHDEGIVVSEIDGRIPLGKKRLSGKLGDRPNYMIRWRSFKLSLPKKHDSPVLDMMFNLKKDPHEMRNLLGNNGRRASPSVIGKAEHLKILLMEWMVRNNGDAKYYSDPKWNLNEGEGDVQEIRMRRTWRQVNYWQSHQVISFGLPIKRGENYVRNEYFYIGRTTDGVLSVKNIAVKGKGAKYFQVNKSRAMIGRNRYLRIKISFRAPNNISFKSINAFLQFNTNIEDKKLVKVKIGGVL